MRRNIFLSLSLCALSACIIVEDYGNVWDDATEDPCIDAIVEKHYAESFEDDQPPYPTKRITFGEQHMFLLKPNEKESGGHAYRFTLNGNIFTGYKANPSKLKQFRNDYADAPATVSKDKAILKQLGKTEQSFLQAILADETYWIADVKTLYNPRRNEQCSLHMPIDDDDGDE